MELRNHILITLGFYVLLCFGLKHKYQIDIFHWFDLVYLAFMVLLLDLDALFSSLHRKATHNIFFFLAQIIFTIFWFDDLLKVLIISDALFFNWLLDMFEGGFYFVFPFKEFLLKANTQIPKIVENLFSSAFLVVLGLFFYLGYLDIPILGNTLNQSEQVISASDISVLDGDTILIKSTGEKIRIYGIDTPEITGHEQKEYTMELFNLHDKQCLTYWGDEAKKELEKRIKQAHNISIVRIEKGAYGRTIGKLLIDGEDWSIIATKKGLAMPYLWSGKTTEEIKKAYQEARKKKKGLWSCG
jgi:endonuclease YncB( thermonuclease family)